MSASDSSLSLSANLRASLNLVTVTRRVAARVRVRCGSDGNTPRGRSDRSINFCLTYSHMGMYSLPMPRASTTSDAFKAVADPRRRDILNYLALQERSFGEIVDSLSLEQPSVSKHLRVLKDVGLVNVRRDGRRMLYRTNAEAIRPLHEWTSTFERFWRHQLNRVKERAEEKAAAIESERSKN